MKLRSKETYWLLKNGLINTYPSLQRDIRCDILIVGSGITGSLLAYQFSKEGYDTVLVDKRDVAMGSTAATTSMLQYEIDLPLYKLIKMIGERAAVDSYLAGVAAIRKIERIVKGADAQCGFKKKKSLYLASSEKDCESLQEEFRSRKKFKLDVNWLSATQIKKEYGMNGKGAILSGVGASLDAYRLSHALIAYSVQHYHLKVFDHSPVEGIVYNGIENTVITDANSKIKCKYILYATGYETSQMIKEKIVELKSTYAFVSEPIYQLSKNLRNTIFWNTETPYVYWRTTDDNRILVGGGDENFKDPLIRDSLIEKKENYLLAKIRSIQPGANLIPDFSWAGTFGSTKDGLPYIGAHPDYPNSFFALGFGGNGITFSVMAMKILSDALRGRSNKFLEYFKFGR